MCGIGGFRRFGKQPITPEQIEVLLVGLQNRGNDATGLAIMNSDGLHVYKDDKPAWDFVRTKKYDAFIGEFLHDDTNIVLLHTRAATKGNPRDNINNHPMYYDNCAVTHNGVISNDEYLFGDMKLERRAETDSDILRAILDAEGLTKGGIRKLSRVCGSVACAAVSNENPEHLLLVRSGSPLVCAKVDDMFVWASEKTYIHKAMRPFETKWGIEFQIQRPDIGFITMADDSAWLLGPKGLEWHDKCKTLTYTYSEPRRHVYDNYASKQKKFDDDFRAKNPVLTTVPRTTPPSGEHIRHAMIRIKCPSCQKLNKLSPEQRTMRVDQIICGHCKQSLATAKKT